ncbi:putative anti-sigma regulatory factor serine/threonine protein kinase [Calothrix parasitica NIES-267]|uniref:Putative anti-sigma regulatory factor serine/threonine protein kinase n=1 Tax=Calothrix parasitica NIES-267 TaxID=1973488 RepID=A0A1Z4LU79_9CYAN|nr:putative anti-sigma regulatory factor serine/threonine protein kinase [Calothrix parasitica NIES-267]
MESIIVSGNLESLDIISDYVITAAGKANLDSKKTYKLRLAVDEIATNIVIHGYQEAEIQGDIVCRAEFSDTNLKIHLEDSGMQYDATQQQQPDDLYKPLEERHIGGLGIYLAINGVDKYIYERHGNLNSNIFIVNTK